MFIVAGAGAIKKILWARINLIFTHINKHLDDSPIAFREPRVHPFLSLILRDLGAGWGVSGMLVNFVPEATNPSTVGRAVQNPAGEPLQRPAHGRGPRQIDSIATPTERRSALSRFAETGELTLGELDLFWDRAARVYWQYMRPAGRPSFTTGLLGDLREALHFLTDMYAEATPGNLQPVRYSVLASRLPHIFNLGGDLPQFAELIRNHDRSGLRRYAHACIDVQFPRATNVGLPIVGIALVQGDALGGGFEAALACNVLVAERSAKFGLPEVLFNL
ncbi:MAG: enoyl-CoA hydratase-related protein, partial [Dongiaceae bacterium]